MIWIDLVVLACYTLSTLRQKTALIGVVLAVAVPLAKKTSWVVKLSVLPKPPFLLTWQLDLVLRLCVCNWQLAVSRKARVRDDSSN